MVHLDPGSNTVWVGDYDDCLWTGLKAAGANYLLDLAELPSELRRILLTCGETRVVGYVDVGGGERQIAVDVEHALGAREGIEVVELDRVEPGLGAAADPG